MKKLIALVLAFIMALTLAACAANTEPAQTEQPEQTEQPAVAAENDAPAGVPEKLKLGLCNINEKGQFGRLVKWGFEKACEERGWELVYADNNGDGPTGVSNAEIMVQKGVDFVVDLNVDASVGQTIMDIFGEANIPVLAVDIALPGAPFFGIDSPSMGYYNGEVMAQWLKDNNNGECDYAVVITQLASGDVVQERVRAAIDAFDDLGIKYGEAVEIEGENDAQIIQQRFNDFLTAHPDAHSIIVFGVNNNAATGCMAAAETAGRDGDVKIISCNIDNTFTDTMEATQGNCCWLYTTSNFTELYGEQCCKLVEQYFTEGSIPELNPCEMLAISWDNLAEVYDTSNYPWDQVG